MKFATPRTLKNISLKLFNKQDERLIQLYDYLIDICNFGDDRYHKLETKYHDIYHFITSTAVFLDLYSSIVDKQIIEKNESDFFCGVVAAMYHDIGFLKLKEDDNGTGAQYINTHVERGCHFIGNNFDNILTEEEKSRICGLIMVTDYFKKVENLEIDHVGRSGADDGHRLMPEDMDVLRCCRIIVAEADDPFILASIVALHHPVLVALMRLSWTLEAWMYKTDIHVMMT